LPGTRSVRLSASLLLALVCPATAAEAPIEREQPLPRSTWRERLDARRGVALVERGATDSQSPSELIPIVDLRAERRRDSRGWDPTERSLVWSYVALGLADAYQTTRIPEHGREANPFVSSWAGSRPDDAEVVLFKVAATWGLLEITRRFVHSGKRRKQALSLLNGLQLGVVVHNERMRQDDFGSPGITRTGS